MKRRQKEKLIVNIVSKVIDSQLNGNKNYLTTPELKVKKRFRLTVLKAIRDTQELLKKEGYDFG